MPETVDYAPFETTTAGYRRAWRWLNDFGEVELAGVEGTGSYGAGLTRFLHDQGVAVVASLGAVVRAGASGGSCDPTFY